MELELEQRLVEGGGGCVAVIETEQNVSVYVVLADNKEVNPVVYHILRQITNLFNSLRFIFISQSCLQDDNLVRGADLCAHVFVVK